MPGEAIGIIPARLGSTRFPGKVLASKTGKPLIRHVWEAARRSASLSRLVVATDDQTVRAAVEGFGGEVVMTSADHPNGSSRLAEAAATLGIPADAMVVNVQGDEPELDPGAIDAVVGLARFGGFEVTTIASAFSPGENPADPNIVKVVCGVDRSALYFSRALIPFAREPGECVPMRHVGLYVYRAGFLKTYVALPRTPLERAESLEQLRILEHGYRIGVARFDCRGTGIDTPEQYEEFVRRASL